MTSKSVVMEKGRYKVEPTPALKVKKLRPDAVIPKRATADAAGMDLTATTMEKLPSAKVRYGTGLAFEIPKGYVGLLFPRSSVHKLDMILTNCVGVIDADYRGEVMFVYRQSGIAHYKPGDRVGQLVIMKLPDFTIEEVEDLSSTDRGEGGFGSTGT